MTRKEFLINALFELDENYLNQPLYDYDLATLEHMHITEKCKFIHVQKYLRGERDKANHQRRISHA